jgi:hypothetical protein
MEMAEPERGGDMKYDPSPHPRKGSIVHSSRAFLMYCTVSVPKCSGSHIGLGAKKGAKRWLGWI